MKGIAWVALGLGLMTGCGGTLAGVRLHGYVDAQRRAMVTVTLPSIDRSDGIVRGWQTGTADVAAIHQVVFGLHGIPPAAAELVATDRPVAIAISRADLPGPDGPVPTEVAALSFALDDPGAAADWIEQVGPIEASTEAFFRVQRTAPLEVGEGLFQRSVSVAGGTLWFHADRDELIVSDTRLGLEAAGPAARAARRLAGGDVVVKLQPHVWAPSQGKALARRLADLLGYLRLGRLSPPETVTRTGTILQAVDALFHLRAIGGELATFALSLDEAGATLKVDASAGLPIPALAPALDRALLTDRPLAALGTMDCRRRILARQRNRIAAWRSTGGPGGDELDNLVDVQERTLDGTCSFAVHTDDEAWAEEASYPLRGGADSDALTEAVTAAIRSAGLPNLESAAENLVIAKLLFEKRDDGVLALDRVLGAPQSVETRHAAALHGAPVVHDRFALRGGRFLSLSGPRADERLQQLAEPGAASRPLPPELQAALASGRGKGGFLFLDLAALWTPYLKAAQATRGPLAELVGKRPTLLTQRRPVVVTIEPKEDIDVAVTMPPRTFEFVWGWAIHTLLEPSAQPRGVR